MFFEQKSWQATQEFSLPSLLPLNFTAALPQNNSTPSKAAQELPSEVPSQVRKAKVLKSTFTLKTLRQLQVAKMTAIDLLMHVIEGQGDFEGF